MAFLGDEHRLLDLGADAGRLIEAAIHGDTASALDVFGNDHRDAAATFLDNALREGLLVPA